MACYCPQDTKSLSDLIFLLIRCKNLRPVTFMVKGVEGKIHVSFCT